MSSQNFNAKRLLIVIGLVSTVTIFSTSCSRLKQPTKSKNEPVTLQTNSIASVPSSLPTVATNQTENTWFSEDKLVQAQEACEKAIHAHSKNSQDCRYLGNTLLTRGNFDEAIVAFQKAIELNFKDIESYNNLSSLLRIKGNRTEAIAVLKKGIQANPNAESYRLLGLLLAYEDNLTEASAACNQALKLNPNYRSAQGCLGIILTSQGQLDEAIVAHRKAIDLFSIDENIPPDLAERYPKLPLSIHYYHLALSLAAKNQLTEATKAYNTAVKIFAPALADLKSSSNHSPSSIQVFYGQIPLSPKYFAELHKKLGMALIEQGEIEEATWVLEMAKELFNQQNNVKEVDEIQQTIKDINQQSLK